MLDPIFNPIVKSSQSTSFGPAELAKRQEVAKQFESILMMRLLSQIGNTIGCFDDEDDLAGQQIQGLFWLQMADYVGRNGGIGLWTQILQQINQVDTARAVDSILDEAL
ncbi:MAG: hypothetical protein QHH07_04875 [Sedimentisphaerales bacterium]|nr:hypothetical protein [Sedimentisphaerales bacterium]